MFNHIRFKMFAILFVVAIVLSAKNLGASTPPIKIVHMNVIWQVEEGTDRMAGAWLYITLGVTNPTEECHFEDEVYIIVAEVWPEIYHLESFFRTSPECASADFFGGEEAINELENMLETMIQHEVITLSDITLVGDIADLHELYNALHEQIDILNSHLEYRDGHWRYIDNPAQVEQYHVFTPMIARPHRSSIVGPPPVPNAS